MTPTRAIVLGALTVGVVDGLDALIFFGLKGVSPVRLFQAIAAGLLGKESFKGGIPTALLGVACHFFIALGIVTTYVLVSRKVPALARQPFLWGPLYGIAVYLVMNYVVVPLSAANSAPPSTPGLINGVLIHMFGVGLISALFASAARQP